MKVRYSSLQLASPLPNSHATMLLPPGRGDITALSSATAGNWFSEPAGCKAVCNVVGWLPTEMVYMHEDGHPFWY